MIIIATITLFTAANPFFDVIEINTSFYGHIRAELGRLWCRKAKADNPDFVFTVTLTGLTEKVATVNWATANCGAVTFL